MTIRRSVSFWLKTTPPWKHGFPGVAGFWHVRRLVTTHRGVSYLYFRQVEEDVGQDSAWTSYHQLAAGVERRSAPLITLEERGIAALRLYQETAYLLRPHFHIEHREVIEQAAKVIEQALSQHERA